MTLESYNNKFITFTINTKSQMFQFKKMLKEMPNDLQITLCAMIIIIIFVLVPPLNSLMFMTVFGIIFVLFLPGYLLISALFTKNDDLSGVERIALSFGLSIAVVPLLGLIMNYTPWGIRFVLILSTLSAFSIILLIISYHQRLQCLKMIDFQYF